MASLSEAEIIEDLRKRLAASEERHKQACEALEKAEAAHKQAVVALEQAVLALEQARERVAQCSCFPRRESAAAA